MNPIVRGDMVRNRICEPWIPVVREARRKQMASVQTDLMKMRTQISRFGVGMREVEILALSVHLGPRSPEY